MDVACHADSEWVSRPAKALNLPLLVGFFTCVGLGAPLRMLREGGRALIIILVGATLLAVLQNVVGIALARAMHAPPLLGVICGALTLVDVAAATFGLVAGGFLIDLTNAPLITAFINFLR